MSYRKFYPSPTASAPTPAASATTQFKECHAGDTAPGGPYATGYIRFKQNPPLGTDAARHGQAVAAAGLFLKEWSELASVFGWSLEDIFSPGGLAWWLGVDVVRALGPEHAATEAERVFDRVTRADWRNPYAKN
ncbi:MAG TPA: hypothetical protein VIF88_03900 [Methylocystis sp.]|jgi:hypothetical protein